MIVMNTPHKAPSDKSPIRDESTMYSLPGREVYSYSNTQTSASSAVMKASQKGHQIAYKSDQDLFQWLCLDKHDDSSAIEILLDTQAFEKTELASISSGNRVQRALPAESIREAPKRTPANHKIHVTTSASINPLDVSALSDDFDNLELSPTQSKNPRTFTISIPKRGLSKKSRVFQTNAAGSNNGSIRVQERETPSSQPITDIRNALKQMQKKIGNPSGRKKRITRRTVMRGLFTMAETLEDPIERESLQKELSILMQKEKTERVKLGNTVEKAETGRGDDNGTQSSATVFGDTDDESSLQKQNKENMPFSFFPSVRKLFHNTADDKRAAERVLDDLLWTEFVADRQNAAIKDQAPKNSMASDAKTRQSSRSSDFAITSRNAGTVCSDSRITKIRRHHNSHIERQSGSQSMSNPPTKKLSKVHALRDGHSRRKVDYQQQVRGREATDGTTTSRSWWRRRRKSKKMPTADDLRSAASEPRNTKYIPTSVSIRSRSTHNAGVRRLGRHAGNSVRLDSAYHKGLIDSRSR